jgi:NAD(P)-dependent dehydrogenase (short-subunit alcohol dehydrogenase family)
LVETTPEEWDRVMAVNVRSVYLGVRQLYPLMREQGGAIVNVSSVHAIATSANIAAYAASKGGMLALTRALAIELAGDKIRVNAVLPGAVETTMLYAGLGRGHLQGEEVAELVEQLGSKHVMGRVGQPGEIAEAIYFLADGRRSGFMTGQSLVVDGGAIARLSTE